MDFRVCLLSQGNLSVFENAWDKNLQLAQDAVMPSFPEAMISDGETIAVCDGRKLIAYQCGSHEVISASESAEGKTRILSRELAEYVSIESTTIRRDFSFLGNLGKQGYGYDVENLITIFSEQLGMNFDEKIILVPEYLDLNV